MNLSMAQDGDPPFVSVVVCTRNRGEAIFGTLTTILANRYPHFELIVIDQSTNDATACAITPLRIDPRLRYISTNTRGLARARNIGIAAAYADIILMTDDDCDVPSDWIAQMAALFTRYPNVAIVFCDVVADPYDTSKGFIPISAIASEKLHHDLDDTSFGIGAGMALRRTLTQNIGNFDAMLGAGASFYSGEEMDIALRALLHGYDVYCTKKVSVRHRGFRTYAEGRHLVRGYMIGTAAVYAKLLKCGYWRMLHIYLLLLWNGAIRLLIENMLRWRRPLGLSRPIYLVKGFIRGLRTPVDRAKLVFQ